MKEFDRYCPFGGDKVGRIDRPEDRGNEVKVETYFMESR